MAMEVKNIESYLTEVKNVASCLTVMSYLAVASFGALVGISMEHHAEHNAMIPQVTYERKIDDDERRYLVVESRNGLKTPMVQENPNEPFRSLDDLQQETKEGIVKKLME